MCSLQHPLAVARSFFNGFSIVFAPFFGRSGHFGLELAGALDPCWTACKRSATFGCPQTVKQSRAYRSKRRRPKSAPWPRSTAELVEVIIDGGEFAKSLNRPGLQ